MNEGIITCDVDMSNFNRMFSTLAAVVPQDAHEFVRDETARLAEECSRQLQMRNRRNQRDRIESDVKKVFMPMPRLFSESSKMEGNGMKWLYASPNALVGVKPHRYHPMDTAEDMRRVFYKSKGTLPENRWEEIGKMRIKRRATRFHGRIIHHQRIMELQRNVVPRSSFQQFVNSIRERLGRLEASFAQTAQILRKSTARVPVYISRHFPIKTNVTRLDGLANTERPSIEFGSMAPGIEHFEEYIHDAIEVRLYKMTQRLRLILSGYSEDVARSISPRRRAQIVAAIE